MDLLNFIHVLLKRKKLLLLIPLIALVTTIIITKMMDNVFRSDAKLATGITEDNRITLGREDDLKPYVIQNKFSNLVELLKSKHVVDLVSYRLILHDLNTKETFRNPSSLLNELDIDALEFAKNTYSGKLESMHELLNQNEAELGLIKILESMDYDHSTLTDKLNIYRIGSSDYIQITYDSENPFLSAFIVNTLCEEFIRFYRISSEQRTDKNIRFFENLSVQKKGELDSLVNELKLFKIENQVINLYEQTKTLVIQIKELEVLREKENKKISSYIAAVNNINNRFSDKEKLYAEADLGVNQNEIVEIKNKLKKLRIEYLLSGAYSKVYEDSIASIKAKLERKIKITSDELLVDPNVAKIELVRQKLNYEIEREIAIETVQSFDREINRLRSQVDTYAHTEAQYSAFEREISVAAEAYLEVLNKLGFARFGSISSQENLRQIQIGHPPEKPLASKKIMLIILSGIISFIFTVVIIFILEYVDLTIKTPGRFENMSGATLLGFLTKLNDRSLNLNQLFSNADSNPAKNVYTNLVRDLRYSIDEKLGGAKSILFTSTEKSEGKSVIIISLAYSFSLIGKKVLIIDSNLKNNFLTRNFNASPCYRDLLSGAKPVKDCITVTDIEEIDVIGSEICPLSPFEIASETKLRKQLTSLYEIYDLILIEGPSLNKYSDSKELINVVDKVISIFSADNVLNEADRNTIDYLKSLNEKYFGAILNKVSLENIEGNYGETIRKRSNQRVFIKKILRRNFSKTA